MSTGDFFNYGLTFVQPVDLRKDGKSALLVIDMQYHDASVDQGFNLAVDKISPGAMDYFNDRNENMVIPTIQKLLAYFREHQLPVVYVTMGADHPDYRDFPDRVRDWLLDVEERSGVREIFYKGNPAFAIRKEIEPLSDETVVNKKTFGAFNSSTIDTELAWRGIENLVVTGISTNACVDTTARDAADRGYGVVLVDEGLADYDEPAHVATLRGFHFNFGRVVESAMDVINAIEEGVPL